MMSENLKLAVPFDKTMARSLRAGDTVLLTGTLLTGRDAAHKRLIETINRGDSLPFDPAGQTLYYVGPTPAPQGRPIGSAGPTSSYRMDAYAPQLIALGLTGMIGKGKRNVNVINAMKEFGAVYFGAVGGAAALIARQILSSQIIAYDDLGTEAIRRLSVRDFPVTVIIDSLGTNLYDTEPVKYRQDQPPF